MTAAHPTLPIPSYARVTALNNGRSVVVRINDRGPFHSNRIMDLSYTAAHKLGYIANGSTLVEVESIVPDDIMIATAAGAKGVPAKADSAPNATPVASPPAAVAAASVNADPITGFAAEANTPRKSTEAPAAPQRLYLQLGAFSTSDLAESFRARVLGELGSIAEKLLVVTGDGKFRLHLGPYATKQEATSIAERVREALKFKPMVIWR
jgi:rare lipoprotein A